MKIGVIADDLTGASDIALMFARGGFHVVQHVGVPHAISDAHVIVVSLKIRAVPASQAVAQSLSALAALRKAGASQIYFKYGSTFDSTTAGNIGPVAEALANAVGAAVVPFCPALPVNGRSVYCGNLFVNGVPLSESSMKDHPLTPMHDSNLVRMLQSQSREQVGLIAFPVVAAGPESVRAELDKAAGNGTRFVVIDALTDDHLITIAQASSHLPLITGASGLALGLKPNAFHANPRNKLAKPPADTGGRLVLAGSCSEMTRLQVSAAIEAGWPTLRIDPQQFGSKSDDEDEVLAWLEQHRADHPMLIYSSADAKEVAAAQKRFGTLAIQKEIERRLANAARIAVSTFEIRHLVIAGGETSGAVVDALQLSAMAIGPEIEPGIPWLHAHGTHSLAIALKSGNFGSPQFFQKAWKKLDAWLST